METMTDVFVQFLGGIWSLIVFRRFFDRAFECLDYLLRQWRHFVNVFINSAQLPSIWRKIVNFSGNSYNQRHKIIVHV
jgi:hypothetical protein